MGTEMYILGIDIGTNSIGWALLKARFSGQRLVPTGIKRAGVRIFEAGVSGSIERGKTESRALERRTARMMRRSTFRTAQRLKRAFRMLQEVGLLPGNSKKPSQRDEILKRLDAELRDQWEEKLLREGRGSDYIRVAVHHNLTYVLRARGLDERLEPFELGRALYQLAQRRGFKSSRKNFKASDESDKDQNSIEKEANTLREEMQKKDARTLGEYFALCDPFSNDFSKIRGVHTLRSMIKEEFDLLWDTQSAYYPEILTKEFKFNLLHAKGTDSLQYGVLEQRELKSQAHLIGKCSLESRKKRSPMALLEAQRFRYLQKLNDTRIILAGKSERPLAPDEFDKLKELLDQEPFVTFKEARTILGLTRGDKFNLEAGGEKSFIGNKTAARFKDIIGEAWINSSAEQQHRMVFDYWRSKDDVMPMQATAAKLDLDEKTAHKLSKIRLEQDYCAYSLKALRKLLPLLEEGIKLYDARVAVYGEPPKPEPMAFLPPVAEMEDIRNPVVQRALTELRKVVNAIISKYGKPEIVRIELARDLKKNDEERQEIWKRNRLREADRKRAEERAKEILSQPTRADIEKVLLLEECGGFCPYTGQPISIQGLLGQAREFDVEHIIPFSRCLDDSFANKTLCHSTANLEKGNRTPFEAFCSNPVRYEQILKRVSAFKGDFAKAKMDRFKIEEPEEWEGFVNSQLNDTRYASKLATEYIGLLYGGKVDTDNRLRVQVGKGQVTFQIRNLWRLNTILNDGGLKTRDDHRHHAVDAIAIALTDHGTIKAMSDAAKLAKVKGERWFGSEKPPLPWPSFRLDVTKVIKEETIVSHRVSHKVNTGFHEATFYSMGKVTPQGKPCVHIRRTLGGNLRKSDLPNIVDERVQTSIFAKLRELGHDPEKVDDAKLQKSFSDKNNLPFLTARDGRLIPIKKVRVRKIEKVITIGNKGRERNVVPGSNNHIEVFENAGEKGKPRWNGRIVTSYEAMQRIKKDQQAVINRVSDSNDWRFKFSLSCGDSIELDTNDGTRQIMLVKSTEEGRIKLFRITQAGRDHGKLSDGRHFDYRTTLSIDALRKKNTIKVHVSPLGDVFRAND